MSHRFPAVNTYSKAIVLRALQHIYKIRILKIISISTRSQFTDAGKTQFYTTFNLSDSLFTELWVDGKKTFQPVGDDVSS